MLVAGLIAVLSACGGGGGSSADSNSGNGGDSGSTPPVTPTGPVVAAIAASRVSGTAPLAVQFDATGTTTTLGLDTFRQLNYSFNFGDDRGLTWAVSGLPKNTETDGPIAAHVFDVAGSYIVQVTATDPVSGNQSSAKVTVTVNSPDSIYSGTQTVCVSGAGHYTGCPTGAAKTTSLPTGTGWNGKRVLLARGESFGDISIQDGNAGVQVGSFGSGALPMVSSVGIGSERPQTANFATDITVMDLAVANEVTQSLGKQVLLYRLDLTSASDNHGIYTGGMSYWAQSDPYRVVPTSAFYYAQQIFLVENKVTGSFNDAGYNFFGDGSQFAMLGNVMGVSKYHTARFTKLRKAIVAHNELKGINPAGIYHSLKLHSGGLTPYTDAYVDDAWYSEQVVVSHNLFGNAADTNQWTVAICPENDSSAEGIQNVLVQSNTFVRNASTSLDLALGGRSLTYRNNTANGGAILEDQGHTGALPASWVGPYYSD
ncbi:PKD domain-containing protein [Ideonella sp. B508-1]|uniref:PKD domain-containing protein n=1 Tax=Ideonella sp. B508-1 TaxID=137716 RepID=UPI0003B6AC64|nr:PKD domain-containing protein [Ideonella sp. B508-1]